MIVQQDTTQELPEAVRALPAGARRRWREAWRAGGGGVAGEVAAWRAASRRANASNGSRVAEAATPAEAAAKRAEWKRATRRGLAAWEKAQAATEQFVRDVLKKYQTEVAGAVATVTDWDVHRKAAVTSEVAASRARAAARLSAGLRDAATRATALALTEVDDPMAALGLGTSGIMPLIPERELAVMQEYLPTLIADVTDEVHKKVGGLMQQALLGGIDTRGMVDKIGVLVGALAMDEKTRGENTVFSAADLRARRIARTEMNRIHNIVKNDRIEQLAKAYPGIGAKWVHRPSNYPRHSHATLDGTVIYPADGELFDVGGHMVKGPHDPALPAEESINCKCGVVTVYNKERGAEGAKASPYVAGDGADIPGAGAKPPPVKTPEQVREEAALAKLDALKTSTGAGGVQLVKTGTPFEYVADGEGGEMMPTEAMVNKLKSLMPGSSTPMRDVNVMKIAKEIGSVDAVKIDGLIASSPGGGEAGKELVRAKIVGKTPIDRPVVVRMGGKEYLYSGDTDVMASKLLDYDGIAAHVLDLDALAVKAEKAAADAALSTSANASKLANEAFGDVASGTVKWAEKKVAYYSAKMDEIGSLSGTLSMESFKKLLDEAYANKKLWQAKLADLEDAGKGAATKKVATKKATKKAVATKAKKAAVGVEGETHAAAGIADDVPLGRFGALRSRSDTLGWSDEATKAFDKTEGSYYRKMAAAHTKERERALARGDTAEAAQHGEYAREFDEADKFWSTGEVAHAGREVPGSKWGRDGVPPVDHRSRSDDATGVWRSYQTDEVVASRSAGRQAASWYQGSGYDPMNNGLRGVKSLGDSARKATLDLDALQGEMRLDRDFVLFRGVGDNVKRVLKVSDPFQAVGTIIDDAGFLSTSLSRGTQFNKLINFEIMAPRGTGAVCMGWTNNFKNELEVVLPRGTKLFVHSVRKVGEKYVCRVEVVT